MVLEILSTNKLYAKMSKCKFGVLQIEYLGHLISQDGVSVDPAKIKSVVEWPVPMTLKALRGFLGLAGYYRKFIRGFGTLAAPLTHLLRKDAFSWTQEAEKAFQDLKNALTSPPVLKLPDFSQPFVVECDACGVGIGAILIQEERPVAYFSEALKPSALSISTYEKEMLAIVKAIRKWRPYLLGKPFIVRTDQKSLKFLLEQRISTPLQTRWLPKIMGYEYVIQYKKGRENQGADALSRKAEFELSAISLPVADWWSVLQEEVQKEPFYTGTVEQASQQDAQKYLKRDRVWFFKGKILLSPTSSLLPAMMTEHDSTPTGGHFGYHKTLARIKSCFVWPNMQKSVKEFVKNCDICQRCKTECSLPAGLLQPLPIPEKVWSDVSMDFIEGLPKSKGKSAIMVVVDRLTKYAHFIPLSHPFTAITIAQAFVDHVVRHHGIPTSIVSDRDKVFVSSFWQTLFRLQGTRISMSSSYHPQSDGQTEVVNRTLEQYLRCFAGEQPTKWVEWLAWAEYSYNTAVHSSSKISPFQAVYGVSPPTMLSYVPGTTKVQAVDEFLRTREEILRELHRNLKNSQERMKARADLRLREVAFEVGDMVFLKLQPYRQSTVAFRSSLKLAPRFFGPYRVLKRIGPVAYRLQLPPGSQIHDVFHVSLLKKKLGPIVAISQDIPSVSVDSNILPQPEAILQSRIVQKGKYRPKTEILVKWKGAPDEDATWENKWRFLRTYPSFILEDKDIPSGGE